MSDTLDNSAISKHLGKSSQYKSQYDASLLVREPRSNNREHLNIEEDGLPFVGCDVWNGYEVSALLDSGLPTALVAKVIYPCDSKYIVESKSMKLYWNSFNMEKLGSDACEVFKKVKDLAEEDLSALLETDVEVQLFDPINLEKGGGVFLKDQIMYECLENKFTSLDITEYSENPDILQTINYEDNRELKVFSKLLKSNCRVTSQPDWGDVYIKMKGNFIPTYDSLLKYIVSFRDECHFHEEICETIYKRIWDLYKPTQLSVTCLYVRRGGWDINPQRCSHEHLIEDNMWNSEIPWRKTGRQ
tara:strand:- start:1051 stop:1956 length:906 start_codon:yes stop_codon:yes gene_type:complete